MGFKVVVSKDCCSWNRVHGGTDETGFSVTVHDPPHPVASGVSIPRVDGKAAERQSGMQAIDHPRGKLSMHGGFLQVGFDGL